MKKIFAAMLLATAAAAQTAENPPVIAYDATNAVTLPNDMYLGEVPGVALNSQGHIFVFHRGNTDGPAYGARAAQLLEFDQNGKYLREIGKNLYAWGFAHDVKVDREDNIWVADKGTDTVVKFNPQGRVVMVLGRKPESSNEDAHPLEHPNPPLPPVNGMFRQVTDMAWDSKGNTYVADGYVNSRIAKYDKDGNWVMSFGEPGAGPGQLSIPHSIAVDANDNVYVADRGNRRIQVFDTNGKLLRQIVIDAPVPAGAKPVIGDPVPATSANKTHLPGAPWTLCITPGPNPVLYTSDAFPGRIYKLSLDGKLLGMLGKGGRTPGSLGWVHEIACPSENTLYVAEILTWRVQKLTLHPERATRQSTN